MAKKIWLEKYVTDFRILCYVVSLVAIAGLVFVHPFDGYFRFSLGIIALSISLLYFPRLAPLFTAIVSGVAVVSFRSIAEIAFTDQTIALTLAKNLPAFVFYIIVGLGFSILRVNGSNKPIILLILKLIVVDIWANAMELLFYAEKPMSSSQVVIASLIAVAITRSLLSVYGFFIIKHYHAFVLAEDRMLRYSKLIMMVADLKAELFFLKKSSSDIEEIMERSFWLYKCLQDKETQSGANDHSDSLEVLAISRNIHEVKKDYYRVISGIKNILKSSIDQSGMHLSEIFFIMEQNHRRVVSELGKEIRVQFEFQEDFYTRKHYTIVSILNNLITNSIEAFQDEGQITVKQWREADNIFFSVTDNGCGIGNKDFELIFKAGYSTKFCPLTGKMSTGLGLSHVNNLTKSINGTVSVASDGNSYTSFTISIPAQELLSDEEPVADLDQPTV